MEMIIKDKKDKSKKLKKIIVILIALILVIVATFGIYYTIKNDKNNEVIDFSNYSEKTITKAQTITSSGVYNITGDIKGTIVVDAKNANVKIVLENANIEATDGPAIYVKNAKNVYIESKGENTLNGKATTDLNGVIYSKSDLTLEGDGTLNVTSNIDGIVSKDNLKILSGTYVIKAEDDGIVGKDSVYVKDGSITITSGHDGIKASNEKSGTIKIEGGTFNITTGSGSKTTTKTSDFDDSNSVSIKGIKAYGNIEISGGEFVINSEDDSIHSNSDIKITSGTFTLNSNDDGIHADGKIDISGGKFKITSAEGIEATYVLISDGTINIDASDDGINAANKSNNYSVTVEITGGDITIKMGSGDTDAIDSNGNLYIKGGTINIDANSPFDYDGEGKKTGGTVIVNGTETNNLTNQMMGGGIQGGMPNDSSVPSDNNRNMRGGRPSDNRSMR